MKRFRAEPLRAAAVMAVAVMSWGSGAYAVPVDPPSINDDLGDGSWTGIAAGRSETSAMLDDGTPVEFLLSGFLYNKWDAGERGFVRAEWPEPGDGGVEVRRTFTVTNTTNAPVTIGPQQIGYPVVASRTFTTGQPDEDCSAPPCAHVTVFNGVGQLGALDGDLFGVPGIEVSVANRASVDVAAVANGESDSNRDVDEKVDAPVRADASAIASEDGTRIDGVGEVEQSWGITFEHRIELRDMNLLLATVQADAMGVPPLDDFDLGLAYVASGVLDFGTLAPNASLAFTRIDRFAGFLQTRVAGAAPEPAPALLLGIGLLGLGISRRARSSTQGSRLALGHAVIHIYTHHARSAPWRGPERDGLHVPAATHEGPA